MKLEATRRITANVRFLAEGCSPIRSYDDVRWIRSSFTVILRLFSLVLISVSSF